MTEKANKQIDVAIVGAGPVGLSVGIALKKRGLSYTLFDKGCLVNALYNFPDNMTFFSTSRLLEIGQIPFVSRNDKPTRDEALEYYRRVAEHYDLDLSLYNEVFSIDGEKGDFTIKTAKGNWRAKRVVISTGFYDRPRKLGVPGEDLPKVMHYFRNAHPYFKQKVLVIGAANSACDVALDLLRVGAEVTMAIRRDEINPRVKYWIRPNIVNRIKEGSIAAHFHTIVEEIKSNEVVLNKQGELFSVKNDFVFAMTGYQPDFSFLKKCGINLATGPDKIPQCSENSRETNVPGIYLAGVLCGGMITNKYFIENTRHHGELIAEDILQS